jgi:ribosomal protein S18 acetylase RimI-like enzyme
MTESPVIRPARPDDAPLAAVVFRLSMGRLADYLFGRNGYAAEIALIRLFSRNAGRFGFTHAAVVEQDRRALGMIIAFPGADVNRLSFASARFLPMAFGMGAFGFVARLLAVANIREAEADEYYVSNIAILPAVHGQGHGSLLLAHAEKQARALGLAKCSLMVSPNNLAAINFYKKHGYQIVSTKTHSRPFASHHRMVKQLPSLVERRPEPVEA